MVVDFDEQDPQPEGLYTIHGILDAWRDASEMVDAVLCGQDTCFPGAISAVRDATCGRIKAAFR